MRTVVQTAPYVIDAEPGEVWDVLADFSDWRTWNPTFTARGTAAVGDRLVLTPRFLHLPLPLPARVSDSQRGQALAWGAGGPLGASASHELRLEATGSGTQVHHREVFNGPLAALVAPLRSLLVKRYTEMDRALAQVISARK